MSTAKLKFKSVQCDSLPIPGDEPWYVCEMDHALPVMGATESGGQRVRGQFAFAKIKRLLVD